MATVTTRLKYHVKVDARSGVSVPSNAIVSSNGFQQNYASLREVFQLKNELKKLNAQLPKVK